MITRTSSDERTDEEILEEIVQGDIRAFDAIVDRYRGRLLNFVFRFVGDVESAEDIVQETFLRAYRNRDQYPVLLNFSTWLYTIAGNLAKSELRRRKRWRLLSLDWGDDRGGVGLSDESRRPDRVTESAIADDQIQRAIESLPENYREVILLRDVEGLSYEEVARIAGCPVGTVKSRVNRARLRLQRKLRRVAREAGVQFEEDLGAEP